MKRKNFFFVVLILFFIYSTLSAQESYGPAAGASNKGVLTSTSDVPVISPEELPAEMQIAPLRYPVDYDVVKKLKNQIIAPRIDAALNAVDVAKPEVEPAAPPLLNNFEGISYTTWKPPDPVLAVGPEFIVVVVNCSWAIYNKTGTQLYFNTLDNWFSNVSPPGTPFDPKVIYDHHAGRWVILALAVNSSSSSYMISVSDDSDPNGFWWNWNLDAAVDGSTPSNNAADFPGLGFDENSAVYITSNQVDDFLAGDFEYAKVRILYKSQLYNGDALNWYDFWMFFNEDGSSVFTWKPAHTFDTPGVEYLVNTHWDGGTSVTLWAITDPLDDPPLLTRQATVSTGSYSIPPDADQPGATISTDLIHTFDCRTQDVQYRNGYLYTAFTEGYDWGSGWVSAIRYLKINTSSNNADLDIRYGDPTHYYYYPTIYTDQIENMFLVFNRSSSSEYAGIRYTSHRITDPLPQGSVQLKGGEGFYKRLDQEERNRWGDYSGIGVDPSDGYTIWIYGEYATDINTWGTWVGATMELIDNGDGTITDTKTGLMWLKNANLAGTRMTWDEAKAWAENLEFADHDDWRLPCGYNPDGRVCNSRPQGASCTETEFWTLWAGYLINVFNPGPFENIGYRNYWTSAEWPENYDNAMAQDLEDWGQNDYPKTDTFYAWAVRGYLQPILRIRDIWWENEVDLDGDGYVQEATLYVHNESVGGEFEGEYWNCESKFAEDNTWIDCNCCGGIVFPIAGSTISSSDVGVTEGQKLIDFKIKLGVNFMSSGTPFWEYYPEDFEALNDYMMEPASEDEPPAITVISPNGNEIWYECNTYTITWSSSGAVGSTVDISLSPNGGTTWTLIFNDVDNDGSETWTIPDLPLFSTNCLIRITDSDGSPSDVSDGPFTITSSIPFTDNFDDNILNTSYWTRVLAIPRVSLEETGSEIRISGTSSFTMWQKCGLHTPIFCGQDVYGCIDLRIPNTTDLASHASMRLIFEETDGYFAVSYVDNRNGYEVHYRDSDNYETGFVPAFGDENTNFHTLTLFYDASTQTGWGYVDDQLIAEVTNSAFNGTMTLQFHHESNIGGFFDVDMRFDNFEIDTEGMLVTHPNGGETYNPGENIDITWNSLNTNGSVRIEYTTDGGANWSDIWATTPDDGSAPWIIPNEPSSSCLVRITDTDGDPSDISDSYFTIGGPTINFAVDLVVIDTCANATTLVFGTAPGATDGYDAAYDQYAPPPPPSGAFDARFHITGDDLIKDFRATNTLSIEWDLEFRPASDCGWDSVKWDPAQLPDDGSTFRLVDYFTSGSLVNVDMRTNSSYVDDEGDPQGRLKIINSLTVFCDVELVDSWNMIGVSVEPLDAVAANLFPNMIPPLYRFIGSYDPVTEVENGLGYWERNTVNETVSIEGYPYQCITISLDAGWNLISGPPCTSPIPIIDVADPGGIIIPGTLYGFDGAYFLSDFIECCEGYWLRASAAGDITICCPAEPSGILAKATAQLPQLDEFGRLEITDAKGAEQTLYLNVELEDESMLESYSLPPLPPAGLFDVRFSSGYRISTVDEEMIQVQASEYPVSISISNALHDSAYTFVITEVIGNEEIAEHMLGEGEPVEITNSKATLLKLSKRDLLAIPTEFAVSQNYPNPFNPTTKIRFALPQGQEVQIKIYDIIGKVVDILIDKKMKAGYHEVEFNAQNISSGVYFYRIKAGNFVDVKKMIYVK